MAKPEEFVAQDTRLSEGSFAALQAKLYGELDIADTEQQALIRVSIASLESNYPEYSTSVDVE